MYIVNPSPLVFQSTVAGDESVVGGSAEQSPVNANVSPTAYGIQKMSSLTIEAKHGSASYINAMLYQLWANMLVLCIKQFADRFKPNDVKKFTKDELISLNILIAYGVACLGDGSIAAYKIEIDFTRKE